MRSASRSASARVNSRGSRPRISSSSGCTTLPSKSLAKSGKSSSAPAVAAASGGACTNAAPPRKSSGAHATGASSADGARSRGGSDENIVRPRAEHDLARLLELAHLRHDRALRALDVAHLHRPHELHLLLEGRDRALRHRAEDLRLQLVARRLEREGELLRVALAQQPLQRLVV